VIALFGPTVQGFGFAPYRARGAVVEVRRWCRPCAHTGGAVCPLLHHRCMRDITPQTVADVVAVA
jgi:heptosyltransferase-2